MLASRKERKLWTGLHLGYEIFITCLQEQGHTAASLGTASPPRQRFEMHQLRRAGSTPAPNWPHHPPSAPEASEERGQRELKVGRTNRLTWASLSSLVSPFSPAHQEQLLMVEYWCSR